MQAQRSRLPHNVGEWADLAGTALVVWSLFSTSWLVDSSGRLTDIVSVGLASDAVGGIAKIAGLLTIALSTLIALLVVALPADGRSYPGVTFGAALAALVSAVAFMSTFHAHAPGVDVPVPFVPGDAALTFVAGVLLVLLGSGLRAARRAHEASRSTT